MLNPSESSVLNHGLSFCPTVSVNEVELCCDINDFANRLRNAEFFHTELTESSTAPSKETLGPFKAKSNFVAPIGRNRTLDICIESIKNEVNQHLHVLGSQSQAPTQNLTKDEKKAIKTLREDSNIVIKPADKGGAIVIQDKTCYVREACRQLQNGNFY